MKRNIYLPEQGRSLTEMLGVLTVIGILTITAVAGYRYAVDKTQANTIMRDARTLHTVVHGSININEDIYQDFIDSKDVVPDYRLACGKEFSVLRDLSDNDFVQVSDVAQGVCNRLIEMKTNQVSFFNSDNTLITTCDKTNDIIIGFNGDNVPIECFSLNECEENAYCSGQGQCIQCAENREVNATGTGCTCDIKTEVSCQDDAGNTWCCGTDEKTGAALSCGAQYNMCEDTKGLCSYELYNNDAPGLTYYTDCVMNVQNGTSALGYGTDCYYEIGATSAATATTIADKNYSVTSTPVTEGKGCPMGQYCFIKWAKESWQENEDEPLLSADVQNTRLYGTCQMMGQAVDAKKPVYNEISPMASMVKSCPDGQYCYIKWAKERWGADEDEPVLSANANGQIYGKCQMMGLSVATPLSKVPTGNTMYRIIQNCPANQYCYLKWQSETECTEATTDVRKIYGVCTPMNKTGVCPYK